MVDSGSSDGSSILPGRTNIKKNDLQIANRFFYGNNSSTLRFYYRSHRTTSGTLTTFDT